MQRELKDSHPNPLPYIHSFGVRACVYMRVSREAMIHAEHFEVFRAVAQHTTTTDATPQPLKI